MKTFYILFGLAALTRTALAQDSLEVTNEAKSRAIVSRLTRELNLNKTQQDKVYAIMQSRWSSIRKLKTKSQPINWKSLNSTTEGELKNILTLQQYSLFLTLRKETQRQKDAFKKQNPGHKVSDVDLDLDF